MRRRIWLKQMAVRPFDDLGFPGRRPQRAGAKSTPTARWEASPETDCETGIRAAQ